MRRLTCAVAILLTIGWLPEANAAADCQKLSEVCVEGPSTKNISGFSLSRDCWQWQASYQCASKNTVNDCQALLDKGCVQAGSKCVDTTPDGSCSLYEQQYSCIDKPEVSTEKTECDQDTFCQDSGAGCFDTSHPVDKDFGQSAAMMEAGREAGVYGVDPNKIEIFKGYMDECSVKVLGGSTLKNCCNPAGGGSAFSNHTLLMAGMTAAAEGGRETVKIGSKYVYDSLYNQVDSTLVNKGLGAMNSWASSLGDGVFNPQFGFYGFTFEFSFANGFQFVAFDPYSFAFSIAVMMVQEWLSCEQPEQVMAMKRGQNLCVPIETYCNKKALGVCVEMRERHCCFNSKLAKIINRQGRAQLGMSMNSCGGFNQAQLQALDFSRIDLSEFIADIIPKTPDISNLTNKVDKSVQERAKNYYEQ